MSDHHKISPTAEITADIRSDYTDIPWSKEIKKALSRQGQSFSARLAMKAIQLLGKSNPKHFVQLAMIEARYYCTKEALPQDHDFVLVELGAGLSPHGLYHARKGYMIIETDLPEVIQQKKKIIGQIYNDKEPPAHHHLISVNVFHQEDFDRIGELYRQHGGNKPLYVIHEGLWIYFTDREKEEFREKITAFLQKYAPGRGYWVTPDVSPYPGDQNITVKLLKKIFEKISRRTLTSFSTEKELFGHMKKSALSVKTSPNDHIITNLAMMKKLHLSPEIVAPLVSFVKAYTMVPEKHNK